MATVGQVLTAPESGWKRYDDTDRGFTYSSEGWSSATYSSYYGGSMRVSPVNSGTINFKFKGSKIRIIAMTNGNGSTATSVKIKINGTLETYNNKSSSSIYQVIVYEKLGLPNSVHDVEISYGNGQFYFDAIDIDSTGELIQPPFRVGDQLTAPEAGWKRYDDTHPAIKYGGGGWVSSSNEVFWGGSFTHTQNLNASIEFAVKSDKVRLIGRIHSGGPDQVEVYVNDSLVETFSEHGGVLINNAFVYELDNLEPNNITKITIVNKTSDTSHRSLQFDAIDLTGRLLHPDEVTDPKDLAIGKRIRAHYQATSNTVGSFSGLGAETSDFIPPASSATPNGDFYFIMVDEGNGISRLVADRNVQHSISWDNLNSAGISAGSGVPLKFFGDGLIPSLTSATSSEGEAFYNPESNTSYPGWKVFDKLSHTMWYGNTPSTKALPNWVGFKFNYPVAVDRYDMTINPGYNNSPKNWTLQASNDGDNWTVLHSVVNYTSPATGIIAETFTFENNNKYNYYRIHITATMGGSTYYAMFYELQFFSSLSEFGYTTRLLTGGISSTDKDNEWENYIVSGTGNGAYTAGDNGVWNWSGIWSWSSTTDSSHTPNMRVNRGRVVQSNWNYNTSISVTDYLGFRPVLEIEKLSSPPQFSGSVDLTSIHKQSVTLTGEVTHGKDVQYKLSINGVEIIPLTLPAPPPSLNMTFTHDKFQVGMNTISLEVTDGEETTSFSFTVEKTNTVPYATNLAISKETINLGTLTITGTLSNLPEGYKLDKTWTGTGEVFRRPLQ
jgi:hypothetical protein